MEKDGIEDIRQEICTSITYYLMSVKWREKFCRGIKPNY